MAAVVKDQAVIRDEVAAVELYRQAESVAFDVETSGLQSWKDDVLVVSLAAPGLPPAVLHVQGLPSPALIYLLGSKLLIGHNMTAFDIPFLAKYGYDPLRSAGWVDTMIAEQLCLTTDRKTVKKSLKAVVQRRLGKELDKSADHTAWATEELTDRQVEYSAGDVQFLHDVYQKQREKIQEDKLQEAWETESGAFPATAEISVRGMPVIEEAVIEAVENARREKMECLRQLQGILGIVNPSSPVQVKRKYKEAFNIELESTDDETMQKTELMEGPPGDAARLIRRARRLKKVEMYDAEWREKYVGPDGRIRSSYWQLGTDTSRYSCSEPNLQQWPRNLRSVVGFREGEGRVMLSADYSQIEILVSAVLMGEGRLAKAVIHGDVHKYVASLLFSKAEDDVKPEERKIAKAASFTLLFAGGAPGMIRTARDAGFALTVQEARDAMAKFYRAFPKVLQYVENTKSRVDLNGRMGAALRVRVPKGPVRALFGPTLTPSTVINTVVQGTAAVGLKRALALAVQRGLGPYLAATVHDEIIMDVPERLAEEVKMEVLSCMQDGMEQVLGIRPKAEAKTGLRWS